MLGGIRARRPVARLNKMIEAVQVFSPVAASQVGRRRIEPPPTRERILDAAERCVARQGIRRVTMGEVARVAGLSRGALYLHFEDRTALLDAVLERVAARFVRSSEPFVRRRRTLAGQVGEAAVFIRQHLGDSLLTLELPVDEDTAVVTVMTARIDRLVEEWVGFWLPLLADAEARGEIRQGLDHRQAGEWIVRMMLSFAILPAVSFDADDPAAVRRFVGGFVVAGFAPPPASPPPAPTPPAPTPREGLSPMEGLHPPDGRPPIERLQRTPTDAEERTRQ